jgi:hypothetical protein
MTTKAINSVGGVNLPMIRVDMPNDDASNSAVFSTETEDVLKAREAVATCICCGSFCSSRKHSDDVCASQHAS